ncbi:MAG: NAD-dependent succinate-semialdehyde dehydrogenase [Gammaproteobacteria bacterium]
MQPQPNINVLQVLGVVIIYFSRVAQMINSHECIVHNPATEEVIARYPYNSQADIDTKISQTHQAWLKWRLTAVEERMECAKRLAELLRNNINQYAGLITLEMGKPILQAEQEIKKCVWTCEHYAEHSASYLSPEVFTTEMHKSYVIYQPLGIILGVMPWNFPFWQVIRFAIPSLMAGNACLLKHSPNVSGCSLELEKIFKAAGFPEHLFTSLIIDVADVERIIEHPAIAGVSVTGSERTGRLVAAQAGKALKKVVLELGGSDPYIVLEDADIALAANVLANARFNNAGQSCIAPKRILAVDAVREELQAYILDLAKNISYGDPLKREIRLGPMARADLRENLHKQVVETVVQGAQLECGGFIPKGMGYFYPATVLTEVPQDTPAYTQELFGPVISFIPVRDEFHAIQIANDTHFGLGSGIFTRDLERAAELAKYIAAGTVAINTTAASDARLPFGGIKNSGIGRELGGIGIREFTNIKTINIA